MILRPSPKASGHGVHRVIPPQETLRRIRPLARQAGVTRLADITGLDRIGIPTFSAVVPSSRDALSVYNGKGATRTDAACGALMEAIERHSAIEFRPPVIQGSIRSLRQRHALLDPRRCNVRVDSKFTDTTRLAWVDGWDLMTSKPVLVPVRAAGYLVGDEFGPPCFDVVSSNGLASGNTIEEAVCHALCELIERDAWTLADLRAHWRPLWDYENQAHPAEEFQDDATQFPEIDLSRASAPIRGMLRRFGRAEISVVVKDITNDLGVPSVMASAAEDGPVPMAHLGFGTHPDAQVAVSRALSELAQSRAVDIQGVREDISNPEDDVPAYMHHVKRVQAIDRGSWYYVRTPGRRSLKEMGGAEHGDILDDIHYMLDRLRRAGIHQVVVVDLTMPGLGVPVVRVLAPGLESWAADHSRIGPRGTAVWQ
jgi:ribosomal protein S12 methylthiotransferase accessory factor